MNIISRIETTHTSLRGVKQYTYVFEKKTCAKDSQRSTNRIPDDAHVGVLPRHLIKRRAVQPKSQFSLFLHMLEDMMAHQGAASG
jgi:hypothetical protein